MYQSVSTSGPSAIAKSHSDEHILELVAGALNEVEMADRSDLAESRTARIRQLGQVEAV